MQRSRAGLLMLVLLVVRGEAGPQRLEVGILSVNENFPDFATVAIALGRLDDNVAAEHQGWPGAARSIAERQRLLGRIDPRQADLVFVGAR